MSNWFILHVLVLLSAFVSQLQSMVDICENEISCVDMNFNAAMSAVLTIGKSCKKVCITGNGITLQFAKEDKYLECMLLWLKLSSKVFIKLNPNSLELLMEFCRSVGRKNNNDVVMMHLLSSYCKPLLLYQTECICISN